MKLTSSLNTMNQLCLKYLLYQEYSANYANEKEYPIRS